MPSDDDFVDAAPCPKCQAPLSVASADIGHIIECPSCGSQFRARLPERSPPPRRDPEPTRRRDPEPPPKAESDSPAPPRRERQWDDERREEPPRRRERFDDDDDDRRRDRRHFRDDDYDRPPPRRPGQGAATGAAVMNFVFAAIALIEGICVGFGGSALLMDGPRGMGRGGPFGSPENAGMVFLGFGLCNLVGLGLMIPSGIGLLTRRNYGRTLGFLSAALGLVFAFSIVVMFIVIATTERGTPPVAAVVVFLIPVLLWLAYAIVNLVLLSKVPKYSR